MPNLLATLDLKRIGLLGLLALCIAMPVQAQWKWRDGAGKLQFSDLPPPQGTPEKDILQRPKSQQPPRIVVGPYGASAASVAATAASGPSKAELERQAREKQQDKDVQARQKENEAKLAEQRRDNCVRAKENMKLLQDGVRLTRNNDKGEPIVIDDRQRAEEMQRTRSIIDSECR
ncbi:DUF4124 domain-containing protein [Roseateles oligotrophus]|uniref:DUF4124 domain-containing protein n=1 Tax=Roseateles oligotrophus TaxID=1769250 RepID=A0ABT2YH04_9BURK|nr:DUF4124 domain-containing protein [Roseateles oligotrophus]MCV2369332.1 DUF4124 domain-containing protein [Roseateles oligotrophus]